MIVTDGSNELASAPEVLGVAHVALNCHGRLDACQTFYADLLGLEPIERPEIARVPGRWLTAGPIQVHLVDAPVQRPAPSTSVGVTRQPDPVANHFCVTVVDLAGVVARLEAAGVDVVRGGQDQWGTWVDQVWCCDPAGNVVELQQGR
jgi:catechol 2,3-dioxygenase-like lactoylglutathione lyase family enzyme